MTALRKFWAPQAVVSVMIAGIHNKVNILIEYIFPLDGLALVAFLGPSDSNLKWIRLAFPEVIFNLRAGMLKFSGSTIEVERLRSGLETLLARFHQVGELNDEDFKSVFSTNVSSTTSNTFQQGDAEPLVYGPNGFVVRAKTENQKRLVKSIEENDVLFAIGPAGSGKTYTAVALAVRALRNREVKKIILTRPAVEAGENLGFLPGDMKEKIDPYLRPLYDALGDMIQADKLKGYLETGIIEIAPLAFMRGRTLDKAFVILDEAQNATKLQLKMFLTRMGPTAKFIITGDLTQIDLPRKQHSGLIQAIRILEGVEGIGQVYLTADDVLRHKLVKRILRAYERDEESNPQ